MALASRLAILCGSNVEMSGPMLRRRLSPEFRIVVKCCRWPLDETSSAAIRQEASVVDWARVAAIIRRHRVDALAYRALRNVGIEIPAPSGHDLAQSARGVAMASLRLAAETQRLVQLCEAGDVPIVILKGAPLASLAYGDITLKHAVDIDLAVSPEALTAAQEILRAAGYEAAPVVVAKDEPWYNSARDVRVELHTSLVDHDGWLAGVAIGSSLQRVSLGGTTTVPTLAGDELFAYLCVHGAMHGWSRLKWLVDLAAYLAGKTPCELRRLADQAELVGAGRAAAQALLLSAELFGTPLEPGHARKLRASPTNRWLVANAFRSFTGRNETVELDAQPFGTVRIHFAQLVFSASWSDRRHLLVGKLRPSRNGGAGLVDRRTIMGWLRQRRRRSEALAQPKS